MTQRTRRTAEALQLVVDQINQEKEAHPETAIVELLKKHKLTSAIYYRLKNQNTPGIKKRRKRRKVEVMTQLIPTTDIPHVRSSGGVNVSREEVARFMGIMIRSFFQGE